VSKIFAIEDAASRTCDICGLPGATIAYFATGMREVVYRHHACDRRHAPRELSPSEERHEWGVNQRLRSEHGFARRPALLNFESDSIVIALDLVIDPVSGPWQKIPLTMECDL
jgi:hypothetical protein